MFKNMLLFVACCGFLSGCGSLMYQPIQPTKARLGESTGTTMDLTNLPPPKEKIVVAVYQFRDQTGQYKPSENGSGFSTAVTQGATNILIKALENSGWFITAERENISDLLNERKIIRSSRAQFGNNEELPPLLFAGVLIEGGIVSYDANIITGGAGIRYFGAGASGQYRQDRVTIYLRAVSVSNGKVLKTVYVSKTILSQAVDVGLFRFVKFKRLLEVETGFTYNEPSELAVTEAIEKGVQSLVMEGIIDGLWDQDDEDDEDAKKAMEAYKTEKTTQATTDMLGRSMSDRRLLFDFDAGINSLYYQGDYPNPIPKTGLEIGLGYSISPFMGSSVKLGFSQLETALYYKASVGYFDVDLKYRLSPYDAFTPFLTVGSGLITANSGGQLDLSNRYFSKINGGVGFEYLFNNKLGFVASADYNYLFSDDLDNVASGKYNDFFWRGNFGLKVYFGGPLTGKRKFSEAAQKTNPLEKGF